MAVKNVLPMLPGIAPPPVPPDEDAYRPFEPGQEDAIIEELIAVYLLGMPVIDSFSGGKDSSLLLALRWKALRRIKERQPERLTTPLLVIVGDTKTENPVLHPHMAASVVNIRAAARRGYLYAHARVTVQLRRAYHELRLAGRDGNPAVEASSVLAGKVPDIAPDLCATDDGRRRALAAIDRALACAECPVDGPARYRLAELGTFLERSFFLPPESALLPPLVAAARQAARPLAPIIAAWLTVSDEGEATVVEDSAAASAGDGAGGWAIPLAPRPRARVGGRRARGPPMRGPRRSPPPDRRSGQPGKPDGHPNGEREIEPARALPPRHFSWRKHAW